MPISFYVHVLEFVTAFLATFLLIQVVRVYRHDALTRSAQSAESERSQVRDQSQLDHIPILVDVVATNESYRFEGLQSSLAEPAELSEGPNAESILNDYIGGFFGEPVSKQPEVDIKAFRSVEGDEAGKILSSQAMNETLVEKQVTTADITPFRSASKSVEQDVPVLNAKIPDSLLTDAFIERKATLDNEAITVDEKRPAHAEERNKEADRSNTMSNKVVLAMLDEAKVVSIS